MAGERDGWATAKAVAGENSSEVEKLVVHLPGGRVKEIAVEALKAKIKVCMFDQYGTVVDMQKGPDGGGDSLLAREGVGWATGRVCDLVAAHPLRELDDRRAAP